jgi:hypothetical protein
VAVLDSEFLIARAEASPAVLAVVVGAAEPHIAQNGGEHFVATAGMAGRPAASGTRQIRVAVIGVVSVQPSGNRQTRHAKGLAACGHLDGLKVPSADRGSYEGVDFREDLGCERLLEAPFFTASCEAVSSRASAHCSHACQ